MSFPFKKTRWIKANSSSSFLLWTWLHSAHFSASLPEVHPAGFYLLKEKTKAILTLFWMSCMTFGTVTPTTDPMRRGIEKKKEDRRPLRRCRLMKNPTEEKGEKKRRRELISDGIEPIITRLASVLGFSNPHVISHPIQFDRTKLVDGDFFLFLFSISSPPPSTTYGVTHIDFCAI